MSQKKRTPSRGRDKPDQPVQSLAGQDDLVPGPMIETFQTPAGYHWRLLEVAVLSGSVAPVQSEDEAMGQALAALTALSLSMNVVHALQRKERQARRQAAEAN